MPNWVEACSSDDVEADDVIPFQKDGRDYAIFKSPAGEIFASDGHCTHERQLLCEGLVWKGSSSAPATMADSTSAPAERSEPRS